MKQSRLGEHDAAFDMPMEADDTSQGTEYLEIDGFTVADPLLDTARGRDYVPITVASPDQDDAMYAAFSDAWSIGTSLVDIQEQASAEDVLGEEEYTPRSANTYRWGTGTVDVLKAAIDKSAVDIEAAYVVPDRPAEDAWDPLDRQANVVLTMAEGSAEVDFSTGFLSALLSGADIYVQQDCWLPEQAISAYLDGYDVEKNRFYEPDAISYEPNSQSLEEDTADATFVSHLSGRVHGGSSFETLPNGQSGGRNQYHLLFELPDRYVSFPVDLQLFSERTADAFKQFNHQNENAHARGEQADCVYEWPDVVEHLLRPEKAQDAPTPTPDGGPTVTYTVEFESRGSTVAEEIYAFSEDDYPDEIDTVDPVNVYAAIDGEHYEIPPTDFVNAVPATTTTVNVIDTEDDPSERFIYR